MIFKWQNIRDLAILVLHHFTIIKHIHIHKHLHEIIL
jgi:hypothetical protein